MICSLHATAVWSKGKFGLGYCASRKWGICWAISNLKFLVGYYIWFLVVLPSIQRANKDSIWNSKRPLFFVLSRTIFENLSPILWKKTKIILLSNTPFLPNQGHFSWIPLIAQKSVHHSKNNIFKLDLLNTRTCKFTVHNDVDEIWWHFFFFILRTLSLTLIYPTLWISFLLERWDIHLLTSISQA